MNPVHAIARAALVALGLVSLTSSVVAQAEPSAGAPAAAAPAVTTPAPDEAQRSAIARALFEEGLRFVDAAQWQDAIDRFRRVLEIRFSAVAAYNLSLAQARTGKLVASAESSRKLLSDPGLDPKVRASVNALLAEVEPQLGRLTLLLSGSCEGCSVLVDAQPWPQAAIGVAVPVDPGPHVIVLMQHSELVTRRELQLAPGASESVSLGAEPPPTSAAAAALAASDSEPSAHGPEAIADSSPDTLPAPAGATRSNSRLWKSPWLWGSVGVVAAVVAVVVVASATSSEKPARATPGDLTPGVIEVRP